MMFIVRTESTVPAPPGVRVALVRATPSIVADHSGQIDLFCIGDDASPERLQADGWTVVSLHDGWYKADDQGGVAIWGQGLYWEIRDTPFSVKEVVGPASDASADNRVATDGGAEVNVRRAIFGV